jgi:hypothetical protein
MSITVTTGSHAFICSVRPFCGHQDKQAGAFLLVAAGEAQRLPVLTPDRVATIAELLGEGGLRFQGSLFAGGH